MIEQLNTVPLMVLLVGLAIVSVILIKLTLERIRVPSLVGYLILGFFLRVADSQLGFFSEEIKFGFEFMASIGVIALLFRVGLESDLARLVSQLSHATLIWAGNVLISGIMGYIAAYHILGLAFIPSLFIAAALTATSVGICVSVWREAKAIKSPKGALLIDVAEMDDISGVAIMALLLAVLPILKDGAKFSLLPVLGKTAGFFFLKAIVFGAFCFFFSQYVERHITTIFKNTKSATNPMLMIIGIGFIIAALAGWLGFSVAIGALFAGLVFSRDPKAVKIDVTFENLYALFTPFFFINIGLNIDPGAITGALGIGTVLLIMAVLGKIIGTAGPAMLSTSWKSAILLGISMIPRAEIAMIIIHQGHELGDWAVPQPVYAGMVLVSAATCIISPLILRLLLQRWPQHIA